MQASCLGFSSVLEKRAGGLSDEQVLESRRTSVVSGLPAGTRMDLLHGWCKGKWRKRRPFPLYPQPCCGSRLKQHPFCFSSAKIQVVRCCLSDDPTTR